MIPHKKYSPKPQKPTLTSPLSNFKSYSQTEEREKFPHSQIYSQPTPPPMPDNPPHHRLPPRQQPPPPAPLPSSSKNAPRTGKNVDQDLFKNLVEVVPLVESLMDRRANPSFKRMASVVHTPPAPKVLDAKGKKTAQPVSATKQRDHRGNASDVHAENQDSAADNFSICSSTALKEEDVGLGMEELTTLREQLDDLHKLLSEKGKALKSAEESMNQANSVNATLDELKRKVAKMESLVTSTNSQLSNAQIKLAERQEVVEKLDHEAKVSSRKVQKLQGDLESMKLEKFAFMLLFQELSAAYSEENITSFEQLEYLSDIDKMRKTEMKQTEEARVAYTAALAAVEENPTDESLATVAEARKKLEAFVF